jgi:hypothetical protein
VALLSSPSFEKGGVPVDMFNIVRAETAKYFAEETILSGRNTMRHERAGIDLKNQTVIHSNFDLIYSYGVYDVSGGLEITVPAYDLYQIVQVFDENHVTIAVVYPGQSVKLSEEDVTFGDHVYLFMRTQKRTDDDKGLKELNQRHFWSVTRYGANTFLPLNPADLDGNDIQAYNAFNTKPDDDGNVTFTFSRKDPKNGTYWMPVKDSGYYILARYYGPTNRLNGKTAKDILYKGTPLEKRFETVKF